MTKQNRALSLLVLASLLLSACASDKSNIPNPIVKPRSESHPEDLEQTLSRLGTESNGLVLSTSIQNTPSPPTSGKLSTLKAIPPVSTEVKAEEAKITVAFDQMPLPNFVQAVYALILKKNYSMDPQVAARKDLVTLHASQLQTPAQIENAARLLLKTYGVAVTDLGAGNYRIVPDNTQTGYAPEILRGRALPEVPLPLRPIYQMVELQALRSSEIATWLRQIFNTKVTVIDDFSHNTLILSGQSDDIAAVLEAIHLLDQPLMKGRKSQRINPVFWSADELSKKLNDLLTVEGYSVTSQPSASASVPITLIPIQGINAIIVYAADEEIMKHIIEWAQELDKPNTASNAGGGYFTYSARYTSAEDLSKTILTVLGEPQNAALAVGATTGLAAQLKSSRVVVNPDTNTLIFQGDTKNYPQLLALLQELDKPTKSALIEVTVAEVTLDDSNQLGVEWALNAAATKSTLGGALIAGSRPMVTMGVGGLTAAYLNGAGDARAMLSMLASSSNANVLSSPRILTRSGQSATIQVGSQIPTINMQQTNAATGGTGVLQSVQYLSTGVILNVKPTIYSGNRIDLTVSQEVSGSNSVGVAGSPIINTRKVTSNLSLKDGTPVLIGGLISDTNSQTDTGVPLLKDIPLVGRLFSTNISKKQKTELLILITPYIVADDHDALEITKAFRGQLGEWAQPKKQLKPQPKNSKASLPPVQSKPPVQPAKNELPPTR